MTFAWSQDGDFNAQHWPTGELVIVNRTDNHEAIITGDFNGDGKTDVAHARSGWGGWTVSLDITNPPIPDLLTTISNGIGSTSTIAYASSSAYSNSQLPFPVQTVSSITTNDGNGVISTTHYTYAGGYYHLADRDFRGFHYVKVTGPAGQTGEKTITETWFHQGNDTAVDVNNPAVPVGSMKGKPYRVRVSDGQGRMLSKTLTSYAADDSAPYFTPPHQIDTTLCDNGVCGKHMRVVYRYDLDYGNLLEKYHYGDLADPTDNRTVIRRFSPNATAWIIRLPTNETVYGGIGPAITVAATVLTSEMEMKRRMVEEVVRTEGMDLCLHLLNQSL